MSAYVVEDKTINKIITFLDNDVSMRGYIKHNHSIELDTKEKAFEFGKKLMALNIQAVNERYEEHKPILNGYQFHYELTDQIGAYKSLQCLIYQCSEGEIPKTKLYHILEDIAGYLAHLIVSNLKIYEQRPWG